ncbi:tyrosine-type recombinase/integrase [Qipengyuania sp. 902]|uniref:tyrosine-type recombinase/integrase n=1 Tax=Qipengyuania sp. 902 TaxID=3417565 RepID=UPI003EC0C675
MKRTIHSRYRELALALAEEKLSAARSRKAAGKKAPILSPQQIKQMEQYIEECSNTPAADCLAFRLSYLAGLRAAEINRLSIADLVEKDGSISSTVTVRPTVGKGKKGRNIPMHPKISSAVERFMVLHPEMPFVTFSRQAWRRGDPPRRQSITAWTNYIWDLYRRAGLPAHSSHSGRRTFITNLARNLGKQFSLRDVQLLAGHAQLGTTEVYLEPSTNITDLVGRLK